MSSTLNPNIADPNSPLETLALSALRRFGDGAADLSEARTLFMLVDIANEVVEDLRAHPYWPQDVALPYYVSITDTRPIPDPIILNGLMAHYSVQQASEKASLYVPRYQRLMNQILWNRYSGSIRPRLRVMDNGSSQMFRQVIDPVTGQVVADASSSKN
jgi:hypothetical protein